MRYRTAASLLMASAMLHGCATNKAWTHDEVSAEQRKRDVKLCNVEARQEGAQPGAAQALGYLMGRAMTRSEWSSSPDFDECMRELGYRAVEPET